MVKIPVAEIFKPIPNYEGWYEISNYGTVRSLDRTYTDSMGRLRTFKGVIKKNTFKPNGYPVVSLCKDGKEQQHLVHILVAQTFIPNPDNLPQVNHIDGNKNNCFVNNLEWVTAKENTQHAIRTHLRNRLGVDNPACLLNVNIVQDIKNMKYKKICLKDVCKKYPNIKYATIWDIYNNRSWKHIKESDNI